MGGPPQFDFPIVDGYGYFILMNMGGYLNISGHPVFNDSVSLCSGWNMIGWYQPVGIWASSLAENISNCSMVSWFDCVNQTYNTYIIGGPPQFDFRITQGMGVFVLVDAFDSFGSELVFPGLRMVDYVDRNKNIKINEKFGV